MIERVYLDITCLSCGGRTNSTRDLDEDARLLATQLERGNNHRAFVGARYAVISIVLDHCGDCPPPGDP